MSSYGISEALRWDAEIRQIFFAVPPAVVTDDLVSFQSIGGFPATVQYQGGDSYKITPEFIPGRSVWFHEFEHRLHWRAIQRVGDSHEAELLGAIFSARGADPALVDANRNLAKEQAASMFAEAFAGEWAGYPHPCPNVPVPPGLRFFFLGIEVWEPAAPEPVSGPPKVTVIVNNEMPETVASVSLWCRRAGELIAEALARLEGIAVPDRAWLAFAVQCRRETANGNPNLSPGVINRNPLNLTTGHGAFTWPGQVGTYGGGNLVEWHGDFASFGTIEAGCWACASNYANGTAYGEVRAALYLNDPVRLAEAIQNSPWDSGHYGYTLADEVRQELAEEDMTNEQLERLENKLNGVAESVREYLWRLQHNLDVKTGAPRST